MEVNRTVGSSYPPEVDSSPIQSSYFSSREKINKAVIIAAGNGSRLRSYKSTCPKPLVNVGGIPLLKRVILAAKKAGVTEFIIVLGYQAARIRKTISSERLGVKITWVRNLDWNQPNGISVLKAERYVGGKFFLFMSDHVFDPQILDRVNDASLGENAGILCVDYRLNQVPNLDDATKVRTENGSLINLGKSLTDFNAIDIGVFACTPDLFDALRRSHEKGEYALSDGVRILANEGRMGTFDIGESYWQDVDTPPDISTAERLLLRSTRSQGDGIIAKLINRRISNRITKWLLKTPITPNQISMLNLLFAGFIAWLISLGQPLYTAIGGVLFQFASILDGCDGEVAVIKMKASKRGAFIDTVTDQLSYILFIIGVTIGAYNTTQNESLFYITGACLVLLVVALNFGRIYVKSKDSASLRDLDRGIASLNSSRKAWHLRLFGLVHHFGRRDMFSFIAMLIMLWGNITLFYWILTGVLLIVSVGITLSVWSMLSGKRQQAQSLSEEFSLAN